MTLALTSFGAVACSEGPKKNGEPCDVNTVCDSLCLLGVPDGICTSVCTVLPCKSDEVCTWIAGDNYCLPGCTDESDCRTGWACVQGACRPLGGLGDVCEEDEDCTSGRCAGAVCSDNCAAHDECPEGLYCGDPGDGTLACLLDDCSSGVCLRDCAGHEDCATGTYCAETASGELFCAVIPDDEGAGSLGHNCTLAACDPGLVCHERFDGDMEAFCTYGCEASSDCAPGMICRETGGGAKLCVKRDFCESCSFDGQCGFQNEKCVSADPGVAPGAAYCSTACEPGEDDCPPDAKCVEASFCHDTGLWVPDCSWCSGNCEAMANQYQCFHDYGACTGNGALCEPCVHSGECGVDGACVDVISLPFFGKSNSICTEPCNSGACPDGYFCYDVGAATPQCVPRSGSCTAPSGDGEQCDYCNYIVNGNFNPFADCVTGLCIELGSADFCVDRCDGGAACPPYTECDLQSHYGANWNICVPSLTCNQMRQCAQECPTGPASCSASAPTYCADWCEGGCGTNETCVVDQCECTDVECNGTCCGPYEVCDAGSCCAPNCTGRECGPDGCGGTCAPGCNVGETCDATGICN